MPNASQELISLIRAEIEAAGAIAFVRFMELALYHPVHGYYRQPLKQIGCQGDFYTSVSVGPLFGQLLAWQFAEWLQPLAATPDSAPAPDAGVPLQLVEAGAHDGRLALDILSWFEGKRPDLLRQMEYWILEPSTVAREAQMQSLGHFQQQVRWCEDWDDFPGSALRGIIFCNELLDAFPVVRLGWDATRHGWFEWGVTWNRDRFRWVRRSDPNWAELQEEAHATFWQMLPSALQVLLPDGFTIEICPAARAWWDRAAARLRQGKLLTLDYGLESTEFLAPHRPDGTLRSYRAHRCTPDPLAEPGTQDLTAHVDFSALMRAGEDAGLETEFFGTQAAFLTGIAAKLIQESARFGPWTSAASRQFQTLTHPDHLGRAFRVLAQSRGP
jgi:SAM-dependent MidA family methyltransferase